VRSKLCGGAGDHDGAVVLVGPGAPVVVAATVVVAVVTTDVVVVDVTMAVVVAPLVVEFP
jgi:hypothetical protein